MWLFDILCHISLITHERAENHDWKLRKLLAYYGQKTDKTDIGIDIVMETQKSKKFLDCVSNLLN